MNAAPEETTQLDHPNWALAVKRLVDIIFSLIAMILLSPVLVVTALLVKITSRGPVFYRGLRAGLHGKPFYILKFRTMVVDAEKIGGPTTGTNDPRITPVGNFLRRFKLDEFPQFINVFLGQMSVIGPRPEVLKCTDMYKGEEKLILQMRPGITDYSSVEYIDLNDMVGDADPYSYFCEHVLPIKNVLRIKYVKNWSLRNDFCIFFSTAWAMLKKLAGHRYG